MIVKARERDNVKRIVNGVAKTRPGTILGVIALVFAVSGVAVAGIPKGDPLKLGMFQNSSRDRLAGTGVIQYAKQTHTTHAVNPTVVRDYTVACELAKKATSGGFNWEGTAPANGDFQIVAAYPTQQGFKVRLYITGPSAANKQLTVYSNCVKSRHQRGVAPT